MAKKEPKFGVNCCGCIHANTGWCDKCAISEINGRPTCYLCCSEAVAKSIKMLTEWCASCKNRKTCAIDEGFREDCSYNGTSIPTLWEIDKTVKQEEKPSPREEILREAIKRVCTDRNQQYGEPEDSFRMIGDLWGRYIAEKCLDVCTDENGEACCHVEILPEDVALLMVLFKVCRGATGEKITKDTLVDIAGYAACVGGMIE